MKNSNFFGNSIVLLYFLGFMVSGQAYGSVDSVGSSFSLDSNRITRFYGHLVVGEGVGPFESRGVDVGINLSPYENKLQFKVGIHRRAQTNY